VVSAAPGSDVGRWAPNGLALASIVGGVLIAEYLLVSYLVDVRPLAERRDLLAVVGMTGDIGPLLLAVATATLLIGGRTLLERFRLELTDVVRDDAGRSLRRRCGALALHGLTFGAFLTLSITIARAGDLTGAQALSATFAWFGSAALSLLSLLHALAPLGGLAAIALRAGRTLALGALLGGLAWSVGRATFELWDPVGAFTLRAAAVLLSLFGPDVAIDERDSFLWFESFGVVVSPVCSGYEGVGLLTVLTGAYLWGFRAELRFPHVLVLVPIGIALSWLANVMRISALMLIGARWSSDLALGSFHSKAGWILFCGIALGLVAVSQRVSAFRLEAPRERSTVSANPTAAYLVPLLTLVAFHLFTSLFSLGLPLLQPLGMLAAAGALWWHRSAYPWLFRPTFAWHAGALGVATFLIWLALEPASDPARSSDWAAELAALPAPLAVTWLTLRAVGSVLVVPLAEELAFRGYLLRRLISADFTSVSPSRFNGLSFLVSSLAFGLLHQRWLAGVLAGMAFAMAQQRNGRLNDAVSAHALANLLIAAAVLTRERWSLWM
jgi:exosortase E/protease (VPEID-CTERM system)